MGLHYRHPLEGGRWGENTSRSCESRILGGGSSRSRNRAQIDESRLYACLPAIIISQHLRRLSRDDTALLPSPVDETEF